MNPDARRLYRAASGEDSTKEWAFCNARGGLPSFSLDGTVPAMLAPLLFVFALLLPESGHDR